MQKFIAVLVVVLAMFGVVMLSGFTSAVSEEKSSDLFRIHIVANSNASVDSAVKYQIKDNFSTFLTPMLASCESKEDVKQIIASNLSNLQYIAKSVLNANNLTYNAKIDISREFFPARSYGEYVVDSGEYDGITVTLGEGKGDNWWCVLFPPLCYYNTSYTNSSGVVYKSKILDIINKFFS